MTVQPVRELSARAKDGEERLEQSLRPQSFDEYVGQEKLRPQSGWLPLAFALDWGRPPRQQNSTSFFYAHTDQWRYETVSIDEILSPTAPAGPSKRLPTPLTPSARGVSGAHPRRHWRPSGGNCRSRLYCR